MSKQYFRQFLFLFTLTVFWQCTGLERNNPLDPKNPNSKSERVVLVEAFVNDSTPYSPFALSAIDNLAAQNESQVLFLEYHLSAPNYTDNYAVASAKSRYDFYEAQNKAVPDVFFNGLNQRVQGAANTASAFERFQSAISLERDTAAFFTIEAKSEIADNTLTVDVSFARLGEERLTNFSLHAVAFEDLGIAGHHNVVRYVWPSESFDRISAGESEEVELTASVINPANPQNWQVVVFIQKQDNKEVLQAALTEVGNK